MFKSLSSIERKMRQVLILFKDTGEYPNVNDKDTSYAFYLCCKKEYIANVFVCQNANRDYIFQKSGNDHITEKGLKFIHDASPMSRFSHSLFNILKGTMGFLLGIIATVISAYIVWYFKWI